MNKKQKKNIKVLTGVLTVTAGMIAAAAANVSPVFAHANSDAKGNFYPDFASFAEEQEYAGNLNVKIMEESVVLMKNKDNALPLAKGSAVSLLGVRSYNPIVGGTGSGGSSSSYETLPDSLKSAGFELNGKIADVYENTNYQAGISTGMMGSSTQRIDGPISDFDSSLDSFDFYNDAAVITIGRVGGEGADLYRNQLGNTLPNEDPHKHVLQLFDDEINLINLAKQHCEKVIILLNTANVMQIPELEADDGIDAILWIGEGGTTGLKAVGRVLNGEVNPSGRTVDIWPADFTKDPTYQNFGDGTQFEEYDETNKVWKETVTAATQDSSGNTNIEGILHRVVKRENSPITAGDQFTIEYEEGIYLGYKYYETADAEGYIVYDDEVVYPFGYGLSYTQFEQEFVSTASEVQEAINGVTDLDQKVTVKVRVRNTGNVAGKEVVQLYNHAPYVDGKIEKAEVNIVSFGKTKLLKPGASEVVSLEIRAGDLASFDYNDANENGFSGWELDAGEYELRLQENSHDEIEHLTLALTAKEFKQDGSVGASLTASDNYNWFSQGDDYDTLLNIKDETEVGSVKYKGTMKLMSRADFAGTFPTAPLTAADRTYSDRVTALLTNANQAAGTTSIAEGSEGYDALAKYYRYTSYYNSSDDLPTDPWYVSEVPANWTQAANTEGRVNGKTAVQLNQMAGLDYNDNVTLVPEGHPYAGKTEAEAWDLFMNQLTYAELCQLFANGGYQTPGLASIGKKQAGDQDGPARIGGTSTGQWTTNAGSAGTSWACEVNIASTYNVELAHKQGLCVGNESLFINSPGWYGPAMNTHRSPFSGRNFEYYSQDGVQGGIIAAAVVSGAQSKGCNVYMKHFAVNDQETQRTGLGTFLTEQAMREIYLKPFEYAVKEGHATAMMSAFNRIGAINAFANYRSVTNVLRDEWGFMGASVTDYYSAGNAKANYMQRGGCEMPLNTGHPYRENQTGTASTQNVITGVWDPELRGGKGGVRDGLAAGDPAVIPESPIQYRTIRLSALHIAWVGANTNNNQNGIQTIDNSPTAMANLFTFENAQSVEAGARFQLAAGLPQSVTAGHTVKYSASNLPEGISIDESTGAISGSTFEVGTHNIVVRAILDNYIQRTAALVLTVNPNYTAETGEKFSQAVTVYKVGDTYNRNTLTVADDPIVSTESGLKLVAKEDGSYALEGVINKAGTYEVVLSQRVGYEQNRSGQVSTNYATVTVRFVIGVTGDDIVSHGGILEAVINNNGELVVTYEDGYVENLGVVVGEDGAQGPVGPAGEKGEQGEQGPKGDAGEQGTAAKGCGGSIAAASGLMAMIAGLGLAIVSLRRNGKKED